MSSAAAFQLAEAQRAEKVKARKIAIQSGVKLKLGQDAPTWDANQSTSLTSPVDVTAKLDHQYTVPFPTNPSAPEPRSIVCPTHKAGLQPYSRQDTGTPPALIDPPRRRPGAPKGSDLGAGFSGTVSAVPNASTIKSPSATTNLNVLQGTSTADAYFLKPDPLVQQPERLYRPFQSTDRTYAAQW
eukprot:m.451716 g.451716  ORF g.451716 m.451716 type:complete len:185 (-) comp20193_c0_seq1:59-613(-)